MFKFYDNAIYRHIIIDLLLLCLAGNIRRWNIMHNICVRGLQLFIVTYIAALVLCFHTINYT